MGSEQFLWKPVSESNGNLVVLTPASLVGNVQYVEVVDASSGRVLDRGNYGGHAHNGSRGHWRFSRPGGAYGSNVVVRVVKENGEVLQYNIGSGSQRHTVNTGQPSASYSSVQQSNQAIGKGGSSSSSFGGNFLSDGPSGLPGTTLSDDFGNSVHLPANVDFIPENYYVYLEQALQAADAQGDRNIDRFMENFDISEKLALATLDTEAVGLEKFLPRATKLIRNANATTNKDLLDFSNVFDARNRVAKRDATASNVADRAALFESAAPGVFDSARDQLSRAQGDQANVRERVRRGALRTTTRQSELESLPDLLTPALEATASRSARNAAADRATTGGFGVDSASGRNLLDRTDFEKRLELEQLNRADRTQRFDEIRALEQDLRIDEESIRASEEAVRSASINSTNLFNSVLAPGIRDFDPLQPEPVVTDIGGKISPTPSTDAGALRRGYTGSLTELSTLSPERVFSADLDVQKYNRGIDLQALGFEQEVFNTISAGINNFFDKGEQSIRDQAAADAFEQGLDAREQSETIQAISNAVGIVATVAGGQLLGKTLTVGAAEAAANAGVASSVEAALGIGAAEALPSGAGILVAEGTALPPGYVAVGSQAMADGSAGVIAVQGSGSVMSSIYKMLSAGNVGGVSIPGVAAGAVTAYLQAQGIKKLVENGGSPSSLSLAEHAALFPITGGFHLAGEQVFNVVESVGDFLGLGSGKNERQQRRDGYREVLEDLGTAYYKNGSHHITLADGSEFDIGKDGGAKLQNKGTNIDNKTDRYYYDVDWSNPIAGQTVGWLNPATAIIFNDPKGTGFVGHLWNAATSSQPDNLDNAKQNILGIVNDAGITYAEGIRRLDSLKPQLGNELYEAYRNGWYNLYYGG